MSRTLPQKPQKLRHMLSQYGEIGRVYLAPEGERSPLRVPSFRVPLKSGLCVSFGPRHKLPY